MPFVSNEECIERFQDFGANLEKDLRFDFFCFKRLFFMENFSVDKHLCAGGEKGKDSCKVNYNLNLISILTLIALLHKGRQWWWWGLLIRTVHTQLRTHHGKAVPAVHCDRRRVHPAQQHLEPRRASDLE